MSRKNDLLILSEQYAKVYENTNEVPEGDASAVNMGPGGVLELQPQEDGTYQHPDAPAKDENAENQQGSYMSANQIALLLMKTKQNDFIPERDKTKLFAWLRQPETARSYEAFNVPPNLHYSNDVNAANTNQS